MTFVWKMARSSRRRTVEEYLRGDVTTDLALDWRRSEAFACVLQELTTVPFVTVATANCPSLRQPLGHVPSVAQWRTIRCR